MKYDYPSTPAYLSSLAEAVFKPCLYGKDNVIVALPGQGNTALIHWLFNNREPRYSQTPILAEVLQGQKAIFISIDPSAHSREDSLDIWLDEIRIQLKMNNIDLSKEGNLKDAILGTFQTLVSKGFCIYFIFRTTSDMSQISEDLLQFINVLQRSHRDKVRKIFSFHRFDPSEPQANNGVGLKISYLQPLPKAEVEYQLQRFARHNKATIADAVVEQIYELSQGIAGIMKSLLETYLLTGQVSGYDHESEIYLNMIASTLTENERMEVVTSNFTPNSYVSLTGLNECISVLDWLRNCYQARRNHALELSLTHMQLSIYGFLRSNPGRLISREEIARLIWGENFVEKYSDWAIDRHMSDLRKALGPASGLRTKKGLGFIFGVPAI